MSEGTVQSAIRLEAARLGHGLWRNNSGACRDDTGRMIRYGLGNDSKKINEVWKSPDLVGIHGGTGRFIGIECKPPGWVLRPSDARAQAQMTAILTFRSLGGIADFATSVEDFHRILKGEILWS